VTMILIGLGLALSWFGATLWALFTDDMDRALTYLTLFLLSTLHTRLSIRDYFR